MARARRLISTTPEAAFTYLSDLTRHHEWAADPGLVLEQTSPGAVMPGATFRSRGRQFGVELEDEVKITDFEPPLKLQFDSTGKGGRFRHTFDFETANNGTLVTKEMRIMEAPRLVTFFKPVTEFFLARRMAKDLKRIAARLESNG